MPLLPLTPFVGRFAELSRLTAALDAAARKRGGTHLLVGDGGVGKTRLCTAVIEAAEARGFARVIGRAYPVETGIPYALFSDAFVPMLRALPPSVVQVLARGATAELFVLFPVLRGEAAAPRPGDEQELKPRLFDAFARLVQQLAARQPLLVVLENLHWADRASLELLHFIARSATQHPLLLLGSVNAEHHEGNPVLREAERSLLSLGALTSHALAPLTAEETTDLVARQFGVPPAALGDFATQLHARTQGNAFFIEETLKGLVESGDLRRDEGRWCGWTTRGATLPLTVRDAIAARFDRLSPAARTVAGVAAVAGGLVTHRLLERMAGLATDRLLDAVDELRRARVLVETDVDRALAYTLAHPLLQEVLYAELGRARARALHGEMALALETLLGDRALAQAEALAVHFLRADDPALHARAVPYLIAAGRLALSRGAAHEATAPLAAALAIAEHGDDSSRVGAIADDLARARLRLGEHAAAVALWQRTADAARAGQDDRLEAAVERHLAVAESRRAHYDDALRHHDLAIGAAVRSSDKRIEAQGRLARGALLVDLGRMAEADAELQAALHIAHALGDDRLLARGYHALQAAAIWRGPETAAREHGERALTHARAGGDRGAEWSVQWGMAAHAGLSGDAVGTAHHLALATAIAADLRAPLLRLWTDEIALEYHAAIGEWDKALAIAEHAIADARAFDQRALLPRLLVWTSQLLLGRGEKERALAMVNEAWTLAGAGQGIDAAPVNVHLVVPAYVGRAFWHLARGEHAEALALGEAGLEIADRTGYAAWALHRLLPVIGEAALFSRDFERARRYGERAREMGRRFGNPLGIAWADAVDALMLMLRGDHVAAVAMLRTAADALEAVPYIEHAALVRRQLAIALEASGDAEGAIRELRHTHELLARLGAEPALADVRQRLRTLGARPPARTGGREQAGALTARETEIAHLVAARQSNKAIGAALDISPRTVGTHLANIFAKVNVESRGALTDLVRSGALDGAGAKAPG